MYMYICIYVYMYMIVDVYVYVYVIVLRKLPNMGLWCPRWRRTILFAPEATRKVPVPNIGQSSVP